MGGNSKGRREPLLEAARSRPTLHDPLQVFSKVAQVNGYVRRLRHSLEMVRWRNSLMATMAKPLDRTRLQLTFNSIFSDVHFWVPLVVLIAGLLFLAWVS